MECAIKRGCDYWMELDKNETDSTETIKMLLKGEEICLYDKVSNTRHTLTLPLLLRGIELAVEERPYLFGRNGALVINFDSADTIMQYTIFNDEPYEPPRGHYE